MLKMRCVWLCLALMTQLIDLLLVSLRMRNTPTFDPIGFEGFRNLLTVASEEVCQWCWADGHQLYYGISDEDLANHRFDRTSIVDG